MQKQFVNPLPQMNEDDLLEQGDLALRPAVDPLPDNHTSVIDMITDVMERRCLEKQRQHIHKMQAIATIASGVAHNFRNTLNEILINSQVLQMNNKDASELQEITDRINTSVKRGARLVDGLLQFSRQQAKKEFKLLDLTGIIKETYEIIRSSFDQTIDIRIEFPHSLLIMGNHSGLSQALINLFDNARDAMPNSGVLRIEANQAGNMAVITISDNGVGMDLATIEKCFDPFFTTKPVGKGIGMGLSATYGIIKSHNGRIRVDSEPGMGTIVQIQLPLAGDNTGIETTPSPKLVSGQGPLLEVVDKEPSIFTTCRACQAK